MINYLSKQGAFLNDACGQYTSRIAREYDKLATYKNIRMKSDMAFILLRVASHLPQGALLNEFECKL